MSRVIVSGRDNPGYPHHPLGLYLMRPGLHNSLYPLLLRTKESLAHKISIPVSFSWQHDQ